MGFRKSIVHPQRELREVVKDKPLHLGRGADMTECALAGWQQKDDRPVAMCAGRLMDE